MSSPTHYYVISCLLLAECVSSNSIVSQMVAVFPVMAMSLRDGILSGTSVMAVSPVFPEAL